MVKTPTPPPDMDESFAAEESPLFWQLQQQDRRSSSSSIFLNPWFVLLTTLLLGLFLLFSLPPLFSAFISILRPNQVKRGWDTLNLFLVLFAIVCGILSRNTSSSSNTSTTTTTTSSFQNSDYGIQNQQVVEENSQSPSQSSHPQFPKWLDEYANRRMYGEDDPILTGSNSTIRPLRRSSSSYPDLRQESLLISTSERWQLPGNVDLDRGRSENLRQRHRHHRRRSYGGGEDGGFKGVFIDKFVVQPTENRSPPSPPPAPAPPPPPPPPPVDRDEGSDKRERSKREQPPPPPPPPPPTPPRTLRSEKKSGRNERKRSGGGAKDTGPALGTAGTGGRLGPQNLASIRGPQINKNRRNPLLFKPDFPA